MKRFNIQIVTPEGVAFRGECESVTLRTDTGDVEILAGHADYLAALDIGKIRIKSGESVRYAASSGGFVSVKGGEVRVVVTTFEFADEIDAERARKAKERAEAKLREAKTNAEISVAKAKLKRAISRINTADLK